jgi:uncharacterized membrane protein
MNAIAYAVVAALAAELYGLFQRMAAPDVNQAFGALLISIVAGAVAALVLFATRDASSPASRWWWSAALFDRFRLMRTAPLKSNAMPPNH